LAPPELAPLGLAELSAGRARNSEVRELIATMALESPQRAPNASAASCPSWASNGEQATAALPRRAAPACIRCLPQVHQMSDAGFRGNHAILKT